MPRALHITFVILALGGLARDARATAGAVAAGCEREEPDVLARASGWFQRAQKPSHEIEPGQADEVERWVADLRMLQVSRPERRREVCVALLDLGTLAPPAPPPAGLRSAEARARIAKAALEALRRALDLSTDGATQRWLAVEVLGSDAAAARGRRRVALEALEGRHDPDTLLALMTCALDADAQVRAAAMRALEGWRDDGVHALMVQQLERAGRERDWIPRASVERHFARVAPLAEGAGSRALFAHVRSELALGEWRPAVRALAFAPALGDSEAVPVLIETLGLWVARRETGDGSRRVEGALVDELRRRSGRSIGPYPERWSLWWRGRASGELAPDNRPPEAEATRAGFYGLRPETDRVTFVIDRSGSMSADGASGRSRYAEALAQLVGFLEGLGPKARFRVVLFESGVHVWKDRLQPATRSNLEAAERWVAYQTPKGGTNLLPAVEEVLRVGLDGKIDLRRLEEDTVIVLCDGATEGGAAWVEPLWERAGAESCVVFHCVQLGGEGNGTLEALARVSGGQFVRVP